MNGLLVIDKPGGMTSRDAVNRVQRWFPRKTKIGHTGTLDPLATGVLVVCVGAATRLADYVQAMGKSYASRFRLARPAPPTTPTAKSPKRRTRPSDRANRSTRRSQQFVGNVRADSAGGFGAEAGRRSVPTISPRQGKELNARTRAVRIDAIRVTGYEWPYLDVEVDCGKGTYIRSIARDLGAALGCGGLVQTLRRTKRRAVHAQSRGSGSMPIRRA